MSHGWHFDNSPSAGAVADGRPTLDRLRVTARTSVARATPQDRVWLVLFLITAAAAGLTGLIQAGRCFTVEATRGGQYELQAIAAGFTLLPIQ